MELKHSLNLLASRYSLVFKILIYFIILTGICVAIMVSIITPAMDPLIMAIDDANIIQSSISTGIQMFFRQIEYADGMAILTSNYNTFLGIVGTYRSQLLVFYILTSIVFFFYRLFVSMTSIPIAKTIDDYMSTSVHKSVASAFTENLWISIKYAFVATIINHLINTGLYVMTYQIIMATVVQLRVFSFTLGILLAIILLSLKYTLLLGWVPIIVKEKKTVLVAFKESILRSKRWFRNGFLCSFMLYLFVIAGFVLLGLSTFFILVPIIIVSEMVILRNIELVCYYNSYDLRYYIDRNTIIKPREELY